MFAPRWVFALLFLMTSAHVGAAVYKWVDANGKVHYGERPPPGQSTETVHLKPAPESARPATAAPDAAERLRRQQKLLDAIDADRDEERVRSEKTAEAKAKRKGQCDRLAGYLKQEQSAKYLYRKDDDGNKIPVSEEERSQHVEKMSKQFNKHC